MAQTIMGIQLEKRRDTATAVQEVLTDFGCIIGTRLGMHQASENSCSEKGLIILELLDDVDEIEKLEKALSDIDGVVVKKMVF